MQTAIAKYSVVIYISIPKNQETLSRTFFPLSIDFYIKKKNQIQSQVNKDKTMNVLIFL